MFDLSLVELLFIAVAALIFIGPQDLPKALGHIVRLFRQVKEAMNALREQVDEVVDASGIKEAEQEVRTIIDDNGEIQPVYDISDFLDDDSPKKS